MGSVPPPSPRSRSSSVRRYSVVNFGAALLGSDPPEPFDVTLRHVSRKVQLNSKERLHLLDDVSLHFKPGTMTLILGASGCGKTTLLKVLANRGCKRNKKWQTGQVLFNGRRANNKTHHQSVAFITQDDIHFATLTVRETLQFSLSCRAPAKMPEQAKQERVDILLDLLDLKHVQNTLVGSDLIPGISSAERKRVTIGVSLTGNPSLLLLDEFTTGLDANMALEVVAAMRSVCDSLQTPVVAALLQPSPEISDLFDNLVILSKGRVAYFGSYKNAIPYFARHGLEGKKFQSDSEFLQEAVEYSHKYSDKPTDELIHTYEASPECQEALYFLASEKAVTDISPVDNAAHTYPTSFVKQVRLNLGREWTMLTRDKTSFFVILAKRVVVGLLAGSLFYKFGDTQQSLRTLLAVAFFSVLFPAFSNTGNIGRYFMNRSVFYVQRDQKYYSPLAYFVSQMLLDIPLAIVNDVAFGTCMYWLVGLNSEPSRFFYYLLAVLIADQFSVIAFRFASTALRTQQIATTVVTGLFAISALFNGLVIPKPSIPDWWIWLCYLNPFQYALEGIMINQLVGAELHCTSNELLPPRDFANFSLPYPEGFEGNAICPVTTGEQQLSALGMHTDFVWRWICLAIVLGFSLFFTLVTFFISAKFKHGKQKKKRSPTINNDGKGFELLPGKSAHRGYGAFLSWQNLSYSVDVKDGRTTEQLNLLDGISGYVRPGMLMAVMGPSGAGKSTLLDVLANRKRTGGHILGEILLNGAQRDIYFKRHTAYVVKHDELVPLATVLETILFSAHVRLPRELSRLNVDSRINDMLGVLDLESIKDVRVDELSMEQRKRLAIGVELVTDPQLLFLEEPTSGLDSQAAVKFMDAVKRVADTGRAVICTIRQPSLTIFSYFDQLQLLKRGGKTVYFGPIGKDCEAVLGYFSAIGWDCGVKQNPADFVLEAATISEGCGILLVDKQQDPEQAFNASQLKTEMESHIKVTPPEYVPIEFEEQYATSFLRQLACTVRREWTNLVRRKYATLVRFASIVLLALCQGTLFLQLEHDQEGAKIRFGALLTALTSLALIANDVIPRVVDNRPVYYREQAAGAYRPLAYLFALIVTDLPITILSTCVFATLLYWIEGLRTDAASFFFFIGILVFYSCLCTAWAIFLGLASPTRYMAHSLANTTTAIFIAFSGFLSSKANMPKYWLWLHYFNFLRYPLEAVVINEMESASFGCPQGKGVINIFIESANATKQYCPITSGEQMLDDLDFNASMKYVDMGITIAFWGACVLATYFVLRYVRHVQR